MIAAGGPPKEMTERLFDTIAACYDCSGPNLYPAMGARLVELAAPASGARVLDVATGRGAALLPAARRLGPTAHITGVDLSAAMIEETGAVVSSLGLHNVELRKMDGERLEFADGSFDTVFCSQAVIFFSDMAAALREMYRVTRPGGGIALSTFGAGVPLFDPAMTILVEQLEQHPGAEHMPPAVLFSGQDVEDLLAGAGYGGIEVRPESGEVVYPTLDQWWEFVVTFRPRGAILAMDEEDRARFRDAYFETLRPLLREDGLHVSMEVVYGLGHKRD